MQQIWAAFRNHPPIIFQALPIEIKVSPLKWEQVGIFEWIVR